MRVRYGCFFVLKGGNTGLAKGARLAQYETHEQIGKAEVRKARDARRVRFVAIKVLSGHLSVDAGLRERFWRDGPFDFQPGIHTGPAGSGQNRLLNSNHGRKKSNENYIYVRDGFGCCGWSCGADARAAQENVPEGGRRRSRFFTAVNARRTD